MDTHTLQTHTHIYARIETHGYVHAHALHTHTRTHKHIHTQAVFSIQAWDLAVISSAKQPLQSVMLGVVTKKLQEVFGKHFFERVLQVCVCVRACVRVCVCV